MVAAPRTLRAMMTGRTAVWRRMRAAVWRRMRAAVRRRMRDAMWRRMRAAMWRRMRAALRRAMAGFAARTVLAVAVPAISNAVRPGLRIVVRILVPTAVRIHPGIERHGPGPLWIPPGTVGRRPGPEGSLPLAVGPNRFAGPPTLDDVQTVHGAVRSTDSDPVVAITALAVGAVATGVRDLLGHVLVDPIAADRIVAICRGLKNPTGGVGCRCRRRNRRCSDRHYKVPSHEKST